MATPYPDPQRNRGLTAIDAVTGLLVILLIMQIWLLSATLDTVLAGHAETALPAAAVSGLLFLTCFALYRFVRRVDGNVRSGR